GGATPDAAPRTFVGGGGRGAGFQGGGARPAGTFTRVADNFYPFDVGFKPLPRIGVTRLNVVTNGIGQAALVRVTPGDPDHMLEQADGLAYVSVTNSTDSLDQIRTKLESASRSARLGTRPAAGTPQAVGTQLWN